MTLLMRPHRQMMLNAVLVGAEKSPVIVIDNFLNNAEELAEAAASRFPFRPFSPLYPGLNAPVPPMYPLALYQILRDPIRQLFGLQGLDVVHAESDFRMATRRPEGLHPQQLIPHYDMVDPKVVVVLHYLAKRPFGGTSLYRHRRTGFEAIPAERMGLFEESVTHELAETAPEGFIVNDSPHFERIASFPNHFNRAIIYRSINLHSGDLDPAFPLSEDPRQGRLTASTFLFFGPPMPPLIAALSPPAMADLTTIFAAPDGRV
jgi:hypothetical protein